VDAAELERLIDALAKDKRATSRCGIYGVEVCQLCGELATFRGWASAMGWHWCGEFVALQHGHVEPDKPYTYSDREFAHLRKLLEKAPDRFCELCLRRVPREQARRAGHYWLCPDCPDPPFALWALAKLRYLERGSDESD
jgi:hypothetical protein